MGYVLDVATNFVSLVIGDRWLVVGSRSWAGNGRIGGGQAVAMEGLIYEGGASGVLLCLVAHFFGWGKAAGEW